MSPQINRDISRDFKPIRQNFNIGVFFVILSKNNATNTFFVQSPFVFPCYVFVEWRRSLFALLPVCPAPLGKQQVGDRLDVKSLAMPRNKWTSTSLALPWIVIETSQYCVFFITMDQQTHSFTETLASIEMRSHSLRSWDPGSRAHIRSPPSWSATLRV